MLSELSVEHLGIVDDLSLVLGDGLIAITGETGAGKTLVVEALDLLLGGRADPGLVRAGAEEARVEGRFLLEGEEHVVTRIVPGDGRSRAYVDGRLATATELAELGRRMVDLHGQHTHQSLLAPATQRGALDAFAGDEAAEALARSRAARAEVRALDERLRSLGGDDRARARELDLLRFQVREVDGADLRHPDEDDALQAEAELLGHAEANRDALDRALHALGATAVDGVGAALEALRGREAFTTLEARLAAVQAELEDAARDLRAASESLEADPERLATIHERRRLLGDLRRKYGTTLAEVLASRDEAAARIVELDATEDLRAELASARAEHEAAATAAATALHECRLRASGPLAEAVVEHLRSLALPHARFEVTMEPSEPGDDGTDDVEYRFAANPGEPLRPLAKVASGGELSRIMLALRMVLTAGPPTLVFDEVDAGIGGEAGTAVGRMLARLGAGHQVLCVTHLAQVAAFADTQVVVAKHATDDRTVAGATVVDGADRVAELSRMLAGVGESRHARDHAAELLSAARRP